MSGNDSQIILSPAVYLLEAMWSEWTDTSSNVNGMGSKPVVPIVNGWILNSLPTTVRDLANNRFDHLVTASIRNQIKDIIFQFP